EGLLSRPDGRGHVGRLREWIVAQSFALPDLAPGGGIEMQVAFDGQSQRAARRFKFAEGKIPPLAGESNDVTEEEKLLAFIGSFGHVPRPIGVGGEKFDVDDRVIDAFLRVEGGQLRPQLDGQEIHTASLGPKTRASAKARQSTHIPKPSSAGFGT